MKRKIKSIYPNKTDDREDLMLRCEHCGRKLVGFRRLRCPLCESRVPIETEDE